MELENLNLVELNIQETQEVEGGGWPGIGWWMDTCFGYGEYSDGHVGHIGVYYNA